MKKTPGQKFYEAYTRGSGIKPSWDDKPADFKAKWERIAAEATAADEINAPPDQSGSGH